MELLTGLILISAVGVVIRLSETRWGEALVNKLNWF